VGQHEIVRPGNYNTRPLQHPAATTKTQRHKGFGGSFCVAALMFTSKTKKFWKAVCTKLRGGTTMNIRACFILCVVVALAFFTATSCGKPGAQAARETTDLSSQKVVSIDDEDFLRKAEKAEIRQTTLAQSALDKSTDENVRQFARLVIGNYQRALAELTDLMKAKNMEESPAAITALQQDAINRLHGLSGSAFDDEFVSLMTAEQQQAVATFNAAAETAADPDIRNYAKSVLALLRQDYDTALALEKKLASKDRR
jgi:putative membrane protein